MTKNKFAAAILAILGMNSIASAGTITCAGQIVQVNYHANNGMMLQLDSMNTPVFFCDPGRLWTVSGTGYQTTSDECKALVGVFLAAKLAGKTLAVVYFDGDATPASCLQFTSWSAANIRYFAFAD